MVPQRLKGTKIHKDLIYNIFKLSEFLVFLCLSGKKITCQSGLILHC
jgi:hypothetical protein